MFPHYSALISAAPMKLVVIGPLSWLGDLINHHTLVKQVVHA